VDNKSINIARDNGKSPPRNQVSAERTTQAPTGKNQLERTTFSFSRASEYCDISQLQTMTGQHASRFLDVVIKELNDNAFDAAEKARVAPLISVKYRLTKKHLILTVADNGPGIPAETLVRILDFSTLTSDKSAYRSITRGAQGNAFKTVLGIPYALGSKTPVVVEAQGIRHIIRIRVDAAGFVSVDRKEKKVANRVGTRIAIAVPRSFNQADFYLHRWGRAFSLFNPHSKVRIWKNEKSSNLAQTRQRKIGKLYTPTVEYPKNWGKPSPTDPTSPWWYDQSAFARLVSAHVAKAKQGGEDKPFRTFLSEFAGMTGSAKLKAICDEFPTIRTLADFDGQEEAVRALLPALKGQTKPPSAATLGEIGEHHFRQRFDEWFGVKRYWYKKVPVNVIGASFVVEAAVAEVQKPAAGISFGCNFSPTFDDPFAGIFLQTLDKVVTGLEALFANLHVRFNRDERRYYACAFHLISPALEFLDKGKTKVKPTPEMVTATEKAVRAVCKDIYQEGERRRKDAARQERADRETQTPRAQQVNFTAIMDEVIPAAVAHATGGLYYAVSAHTLFYSARPLSQKLTTKELDSKYFEQTLLPAYQKEHGPILLTDGQPAIYYEPRGVLYEPHSGKEVPLGTREVADYQFPSHLFDKITFIEKQGLWPTFQRAKLAEMFDMAIVAGEGYATEACRILLANADKSKDYQLFVLHDADHYGKNIARTLREETLRMPGHKANVIDLGLTIADAIEMGFEPEEYTRRKALPKELELTELEREYFEGVQKTFGKKPSWVCKRVEYNALTAPQQIEYAIRKLKAAGVRPKLIPPERVLKATANAHMAQVVNELVREAALETIRFDEIVAKVARKLRGQMNFKQVRKWVKDWFQSEPTLSWKEAVKRRVDALLSGRAPAVKKSTRELIVQMLQK